MGILAIGKATELQRVPLGRYVGVLLGNVESIGLIDYGHVLEVIDPVTRRRVYAVAAERNMMAEALGGGSHFICAYDGPTHLNYGSSDEWADRNRFLARAVELARDHLKLTGDLIPTTRPAYTEPRSIAPPPITPKTSNRPSTPAMVLTLVAVAMIALNQLVTMSRFIEFHERLMWFQRLTLLTGLALLAASCLLTRRDGILRAAGLFALLGLLLSTVKIIRSLVDPDLMPEMLDRLSAMPFFMLALGCQAAFLMRLAIEMELRFGLYAAFRLIIIWGLLSVARFVAAWVNLGDVPMWMNAATLLGIVLWLPFHLSMTIKASRN